jgi:hypothetical protein
MPTGLLLASRSESLPPPKSAQFISTCRAASPQSPAEDPRGLCRHDHTSFRTSSGACSAANMRLRRMQPDRGQEPGATEGKFPRYYATLVRIALRTAGHENPAFPIPVRGMSCRCHSNWVYCSAVGWPRCAARITHMPGEQTRADAMFISAPRRLLGLLRPLRRTQ